MTSKKNVTIIGSGISGISSAYYLQNDFDVTLIESQHRLGGHTHTVLTHDKTAVDTGFIVFNLKNYPFFTQFLSDLDVAYQNSDMSFGYYDALSSFWYSSDFPWGVFSQKKHLLSPKFWSFLREINRFNTQVCHDLDAHTMGDLSLDDYLQSIGCSHFFKQSYVLPMGAAIWSCPLSCILSFPAHSFFSFWKNHALLTLGKRPTWKTVKGGSQRYIDAFKAQFNGRILTGCPATSVKRHPHHVTVTLHDHSNIETDYVILATHADQALRLLSDPSTEEKTYLGAWNYSKNTVCLHTDPSVMPPHKNAWSSWLVKKPSNEHTHLQMTYYMNRLQRLNASHDYFVTLNQAEDIDPSTIQHTIQ